MMSCMPLRQEKSRRKTMNLVVKVMKMMMMTMSLFWVTTTVIWKTDAVTNPGRRSCSLRSLHKIFVFLHSFRKCCKYGSCAGSGIELD